MNKQAVKIFLFFFIIVPVGTFLHELGHFLIAKCLYLKVYICYSSTYYFDYVGNLTESFAEFLVTMGGPLSTILISLIGTYFLFQLNKNDWNKKKLFLLVLSLFMSREVLMSLIILFKYNYLNIDEYKIFSYLDISPPLSTGILFVFSFLFCAAILFYSIPRKKVLSVFVFGVLGSVIGFLFWEYMGVGHFLFDGSSCT